MTNTQTTTYDKRHGGPYDRGSADRYYGRPYAPHYYAAGTGLRSERLEQDDMNPAEIEAYRAGYIECDDKKDWGR